MDTALYVVRNVGDPEAVEVVCVTELREKEVRIINRNKE